MRIQHIEHIQAAIKAENVAYQPPSDINTLDCEGSSPIGGLPSPAASPPHVDSQLHGARPTPSAVSDPQEAQPMDSNMAEVDVEAEGKSDLVDRQRYTQMEQPPQLSVLPAYRKGNPIYPSTLNPNPVDEESSDYWSASATTSVSRRPQPLPCPTITNRSKASPQTIFLELEGSGGLAEGSRFQQNDSRYRLKVGRRIRF